MPTLDTSDPIVACFRWLLSARIVVRLVEPSTCQTCASIVVVRCAIRCVISVTSTNALVLWPPICWDQVGQIIVVFEGADDAVVALGRSHAAVFSSVARVCCGDHAIEIHAAAKLGKV